MHDENVTAVAHSCFDVGDERHGASARSLVSSIGWSTWSMHFVIVAPQVGGHTAIGENSLPGCTFDFYVDRVDRVDRVLVPVVQMVHDPAQCVGCTSLIIVVNP